MVYDRKFEVFSGPANILMKRYAKPKSLLPKPQTISPLVTLVGLKLALPRYQKSLALNLQATVTQTPGRIQKVDPLLWDPSY